MYIYLYIYIHLYIQIKLTISTSVSLSILLDSSGRLSSRLLRRSSENALARWCRSKTEE